MNQDEHYWFSIDNALELVFTFGDSGVITYANNAAKEQLEYGELLCGTHISAVFPGMFHATENGFLTEYKFGDALQELMAYRQNRTCFRAEVRIVQSRTAPPLYVCMAFDVSKRDFLEKEIKNVEREAEEAMKVKSEFVANVTHELRTPVNGILGNTKELLERTKDEGTLKILRMIERGCMDMNGLINNILDFSKLEAGKFTLETRKFDFRNMIDYVKANHSNKIIEKGLEFFVTISPEVPEYIIGDELRIVQILNNLLSNACKFTSVGKIVMEAVKTAQINNRAELFFLVIDTGIGIDKADQEKLFKSFSQVDASISRKYGGTGLGLNICKQLVELMGGNISVQSEKNEGTMFSFSIWVEIPEDELNGPIKNTDIQTAINEARQLQHEGKKGASWDYGTKENLDEIKKQMSKFILSVEMENWEKAEMFIGALKQLTDAAPREIKSAFLRLKMAVQKEDYEKTIAAYEKINDIFSASGEE